MHGLHINKCIKLNKHCRCKSHISSILYFVLLFKNLLCIVAETLIPMTATGLVFMIMRRDGNGWMDRSLTTRTGVQGSQP